MSTKRSIGIIIGLIVSFQVFSQQIPLYNLYYFNPFLYNPARAGMGSEGPNVYGLFRKQWTDMPGSPDTKIITMDGSFDKMKIGLGGMIESDKTDLISKTTISAAYSYHIKFDEKQGISAGIMMDFVDQSINFDDAVVEIKNDPALFGNDGREMGYDASAGIDYYYKDLNVGISAPQLISGAFKYYQNYHNSTFTPVSHFILSAQYKINVEKDLLSFEPSAMMRIESVVPNQLDLGGMFKYKNFAWIGAFWRSDYSCFFNAGLKLYDALMIGYSYEWVNNELSSFVGSTHEIMVGYTFGNNKKVIEKQLLSNSIKIDSLNSKIGDLNEEVGYLSRKTIKHSNELEELAEQVQALRIDEGKIQKDLLKDDNLPKFAGIVLFNTNSYDISPTFKKDLDIIVGILNKDAGLRLDIQGHTDNVGPDSYNDPLSDRRVIAVKNYLVQKGIDARRISINGLGQRFPKVPNSSVDNRAINRRVEIAIIKGVPSK